MAPVISSQILLDRWQQDLGYCSGESWYAECLRNRILGFSQYIFDTYFVRTFCCQGVQLG